MTRRLPRACSSVLAVLLIAACTVTTSDPGDDDQRAVERFREQNAVQYDLTAPRTAQELGVEPGRDSAIFDRDSSEYWDVTFQLPGGTTFRTGGAIAVAVIVSDEPDALVNSVGINVQAQDDDELAELLQRDVAQLGLQPADVQEVLREVQQQPLSLQGSGFTRGLTGGTFGYLSTYVEVRTSLDDDRIAVNYDFNWDPAGAAPAPAPSVG